MAISSSTRKAGPFIGNDATTVFPFAFKVFTSADLRVVRTNALGVESDLVLDTDYTVALNANQDNDPGGTVTRGTALPTGERLTITSDVEALQPLVLTNNGGFYPRVINDAFDKITIIAQQLIEQVGRSLKLPISSSASATLPDPVANRLIAWNSSANGFTNVNPASLATVAAYADANLELFTGNGTQTAFTLAQDPAVLANLDVSISGVTQVGGEDFTWVGTTLTFVVAPPNGTRIQVRYTRAIPPVDLAAAVAAAEADRVATAADRVQTGLDVIATAADAVATAADVVSAEADRVATAADRVQTGLDRAATAADRVQTGLDVIEAASILSSKQPLDADLTALAALTAPAATLTAQNINVLYSSRYASLKAAILAWMAVGGTLVINQDHMETATIVPGDGTFLVGLSYRLTTQGARTVTYNGADTTTVWRLYLDGQNELVFDGDLTLNCQDKAATGFFLDGTGVSGTDRRDCILRGLKVKNCRMTVALATSLGANGIVVRGGFDLLHMDNVRVDDITRQALSGSIGSYGTTGIQYFGNAGTTSNAKRILLENFEVNNIESEDTVNTAAFTDMDGVLIFQYKVGTDDVQAPIIRNGYLTECLGRGVKRYATAFGGETSNLTLRRSQIGRFEGPQEVVHQDASGAIRDIEIIYSGTAHNSTTPTIAIGLSLIASLDNGGATVERVSIRDSTGVAKAAVIHLFMSATDSFRRQFSFKNIKDTGTAVTFVRPGAIASVSDCYINMENINVSLTSAVALTEDDMFYLKAVANGFVNRGSTVPAVRNDAGVMKGLRWGDWWGDDGTVGVTRYFPVWRGNAAFSNGFRGPGGGCVDAPAYGECEVFGRTPLPSYTVAASGGLWEIAPFGSYQDKGGDYTVKINRRDVSTFAPFTLSTTFNSTALAVLTGAVPSGWDVRSGGSPSGGGTNIEVWKDSTTQALRITNYSGVDAVLDLVFNP